MAAGHPHPPRCHVPQRPEGGAPPTGARVWHPQLSVDQRLCWSFFSKHPTVGCSPRTVIRGESSVSEHTATPAYAAITDWLNFTFEYSAKPEALRKLFMWIFEYLGPKFAPAVETGRGLHGYTRCFTLGETGAMLAIGGQRGTAFISMPGEACSLIEDWQLIVSYFGGNMRARISRWDGAVDDYEGVHSVDLAVHMYLEGRFTTGGNKPSISQQGNWLVPDGTGRTFYIGKRGNGKLFRIYEKGQQLGELWSRWVRWELELHNRDRVIPWNVLLEPGSYFVGAFPKALNWVQTEMIKVHTIQKQLQIGYEHLTECASVAYGSLLNVMRTVEGSPEAAFNRLVRAGAPRRLRHPYPEEPGAMIDTGGME